MIYLLIMSSIFTLCTGQDESKSYLAGIICEPGVDITFLDHEMRSYLMTFEFDLVTHHVMVNELSVEAKTDLRKKIWNETYDWYSMASTSERTFAITSLMKASADSREGIFHLKILNKRGASVRANDFPIHQRNQTLHVVTLIDYFTCERSYFSYYWQQKGHDENNVFLYDYQRSTSWKVGSFADWVNRPHMKPKYMIAMVSIPNHDQLGMVIYADEKWKYGSLDDVLKLKSLPVTRKTIPFRVADRDFK